MKESKELLGLSDFIVCMLTIKVLLISFTKKIRDCVQSMFYITFNSRFEKYV